MCYFVKLPFDRILNANDSGLFIESDYGKAQLPWSVIKSIEEIPDYLNISGAGWIAILIPDSAFSSKEQKEEFKRYVSNKLSPSTSFDSDAL